MDAAFCMTSNYMKNVFNPQTPDHPDVLYLSYGGSRKMDSSNFILWVPHSVIEKREGKLKKKN